MLSTTRQLIDSLETMLYIALDFEHCPDCRQSFDEAVNNMRNTIGILRQIGIKANLNRNVIRLTGLTLPRIGECDNSCPN